ncbi:AraC family transcriptional regulator [Phyllobacterium salinisoli]|uniref:AraC family transcriptional regulator n=1 Tax=Phyllobacterium salinisoli TaxID=1899321 RepID=A0A368K065_9HYPH|nr:AraC family transcriptional regulator [Phyllobacterium salinisoli]RCS21812.1 AraC family transcriptional regulator [Phyllobacterium salinisoli]
MYDLRSGHQPASAGVSRRRDEAGPILMLPIPDHRIVVHASAATWTRCRATGTKHLRQIGDIDLVPAGEEGGYEAAAACEALEIRLTPHVLERVAREAGRGGGRAGLEARHILRNESIVHLARALESAQREGGPGGSLYADTVGFALALQLVDMSRGRTSHRNGLSAAQLRRLFEFIEAHLDQPLTIGALAHEAGASSSHLRHWFKQATGTTVHRYVVRRRVEKARIMLLQGTLSASEVALASGFSHQSHMARWMRRELGYTPRELP